MNFVEFRDNHNCTLLEAMGVPRQMENYVSDTWQAMCHKACIGKWMCDTWHARRSQLVRRGEDQQRRNGGNERKGKEKRKREKKEKKGK